MLTDDDLTRQLGEAFRLDAREMTYDGPVPQLRTRPVWARPGLVALPAAGAVAAAVLVAGSLGDPAPPATPGAATAAPSPAGPADPVGPSRSAAGTVTEEIHLAGMTFSYERGAGDPALDDQFLREYDPGELPAWAQPVELEQGASAKVWVGQDPATGTVSMFVESPQRWEGRLVGLASPSITVEQMTSLAQTGRLS
ncbi:hypothetical protein [Nocardioides zeicaulis]|uniref:Anti-sigma factor n=1 Tax=Nocardioides zeicaulis TaxID=1776857 RepID=A0ABV6E336_9ACTN